MHVVGACDYSPLEPDALGIRRVMTIQVDKRMERSHTITKYTNLAVNVAAALLVATTPGCAKSDETASSKVFYTAVPKPLQTEVSKRVAGLSERHNLAPEAASGIRSAVQCINLKYGEAVSGKEPREMIQRLDAAAVPVIAELLLSQDSQTRRKAIEALNYILRPRERLSEDYAATEAALAVLFRRSQFDSDAQVRRMAVGSLSNIGVSHFPNIPDTVKEGIEQGLADPDAGVRRTAEQAKKMLGLVPGARGDWVD